MTDPISMLAGGFAHVLQGGAIFHAFWTIQERDRSCRVASSWISFSMSSGKYRDCLRLSEPAIAS